MRRRTTAFLLCSLFAACGGLPSDEIGANENRESALNVTDSHSTWPWAGARWPNNTIPFVIDDGTLAGRCRISYRGNSLIGSLRASVFLDVVDRYERTLPIKFERHPASAPPAGAFLLVVDGEADGSASAEIRGMPTDGNPVNCLQMSEKKFGEENAINRRRTVRHELGHVFGANHEQQRPDAPQYIDFADTRDHGAQAECMPPRTGVHAKIFGIDAAANEVAPYDYDSIMQYSSANSCVCKNGDDETGVCAVPPMLKKGACTPTIDHFGDSNEENAKDCRWIVAPVDLSRHDVNGFYRAYERALGTNDPNDNFGAAIVTGDFDGDGYRDLAIGAPNDDNGVGKPSGAVYLFRGTASSTSADVPGPLTAWRRLAPSDWSDRHGQFGKALAVGDFNGDKVVDLAVGAPGGGSRAGAVYLYESYVVDVTVRTLRAEVTLTQASLQLPLDDGSEFGTALAAGDFAGEGRDYVVIGAPNFLADTRSGAAFVVRAEGNGTVRRTFLPFSWNATPDLAGARFGESFVVGNFNGDDLDDLAIGSPETNTITKQGRVFVAFGGNSGMLSASTHILTSPTSNIGFGKALTKGNFDGYTHGSKKIPQLAVGAPLANGTRGAVYVYRPLWLNSLFLIAYERALQAPSPTVGDRFGAQLGSGQSHLYGDTAWLIVGMPTHADNNGALVVFPRGTADTPEVDFIAGINACGTGSRMGAGIAFAPLDDTWPVESQLVVGCPDANSGAGSVRLGALTPPNAAVWTTRLTQASASPEKR